MRLARPVLEERIVSHLPAGHPLFERLVDAREAAYRLNLPVYLLNHLRERRRLSVPHYRVGKLVRFKLSELIGWVEAQQALKRGEIDDA